MKYETTLNHDILIDLGKRIKQQRLNQNISASQLAEKSGVSMRTITGFERGEKNISLLNLIEILRALKLIHNLKSLVPELPKISPLELMSLESKTKKRARR